MKKVINVFNILIEKLQKNHIDEYTAQCAYFTLLAFIPLIMLILTLTKYIGIDEKTLFVIIEKISTGNILNEAILGIIKEVYSKSVGTITISAIFVLWSAGKGFLALCKGLNAAYEINTQKKFMYFRIKATICTIVFILLIILMLLIVVFGNQINNILQEKFNIFSTAINALLKNKVLITTIILFLVLLNVYKFIPKHKYKMIYQIPGAIFAAIACNIISIFYSIYVNLFTGFSVMYGSLTTIVLAMMWIYACMYSILLGATINKIISEILSKRFIKN